MKKFKILDNRYETTGTNRNMLAYGSYLDETHFQIDIHEGTYMKRYDAFYGMTTFVKWKNHYYCNDAVSGSICNTLAESEWNILSTQFDLGKYPGIKEE